MKIKYFEMTKSEYEHIIEECMLDETYQELLEYKIKGYSIIKIADLLCTSEATVSVMVAKLKKKIMKVYEEMSKNTQNIIPESASGEHEKQKGV